MTELTNIVALRPFNLEVDADLNEVSTLLVQAAFRLVEEHAEALVECFRKDGLPPTLKGSVVVRPTAKLIEFLAEDDLFELDVA